MRGRLNRARYLGMTPSTATTAGDSRPTALDPKHPTTGDCGNCHVPTPLFATNLLPTAPKPANHIPTTAPCAQCHTTTPPFTGNTMPTNHIPLPAGAACATCHAAGYSPSLSKMVHSAVTSESCTTCHGAGKGPFAGTSPGTGGQPVQPPGTVGTSGTGNHIPVSSADCVGCHAATDTESGTGFKLTGTPALSATGHTAVNALTCQTCHNSGMAWYGVTIVVPPGTVGTSGSANHIAVGTGGCSTCHATNIAVGGFKITSTPSLASAGHAAVSSLACASCHGAGSAWYGVPALVTSLSTHIPFGTAACSACHGSNFVTGGFKITSAPLLSTANHMVVSGMTCASCHNNTTTDLAFQGVGTNIYVRPGTVAAGLSPVDATHATGTLATADCAQCHTTAPPPQMRTMATAATIRWRLDPPISATSAPAVIATNKLIVYTPPMGAKPASGESVCE